MVISSDYHTLFSDTVWYRARQYADTNRVHFLGVNRAGGKGKNDRFFFSVSGSNKNEYTVTIRPGRYRGDFEATCDCPYEWDDYCKHIGAAILDGIEDGIFTLIDYSGKHVEETKPIGKQGPASPQEERKLQRELLLDLSRLLGRQTGNMASPSEVLSSWNYGARDMLFPGRSGRSAEVTRASQCFLLVFIIERKNDPYGYRFSRNPDPLTLAPGAQYLKKDGSPGRYESYRDSQTFMPLTDSERGMLAWLLDSESKCVSFGYALPRLLQDRSLRIVMKRYRSYVEASIEELKGVRVSFEFGGLENANNPVFHPRLTFESDGVRSDPMAVDALEYGESGTGVYICAGEDGIIYYANIDALDARYLARILRKREVYTINDIMSISQAIDSSFLKIDPPEGKILIKPTKPELVLYLDARSGGLLIHPAFTYGTRTIEFTADAQLLVDMHVDDTLHVHRRDYEAEALLLEWFSNLCSNDFVGFHAYALEMDVSEFLFRYGEACLDAGVNLFLKGDNKPIRRSGSFNIVASSGIDWLDLKIRIDGHDVAPGNIDFRRGTVNIDGEYRLLDTQTLDRLRSLCDSGKQGKESIQLSRFDLTTISQIEPLIEEGEDFDLDRIRSALAKLSRGFDTKQLRRPKGMGGTLRPYQKAGVKWLQFLSEYGFGGILADDMGLGKTIQAIALLAHLRERGVEGPYLVIAPVSTISNWVREIERFCPKMPAYPHIGPERPARTADIASYRGVVVTSYHTLQRDIDLFEPLRWSQLILDESQALKNPTAKTHKTVRRLTFDRVIAMSGTPVENNIQELWSVMSILNPGLLGTKTDFMKRFRKRIAGGDENAIEALRAKLRPFLLRRTKEQVAGDLPAKEEVSIDVSLSQSERAFYDTLKEKLRDEVRAILASEEPFRAANVILTALTRLRQAAIAPNLVGGPQRSSKLDTVMEKLEEGVSEGHKILVFSQYVRVLQILQDRVRQREWEYRYLDGSIASGKRRKIIDEFQNNPGVHIFIISIKAGGVGINLTEADYVFLVDPWWNPAVESQAIDRTHRIGQKKPVFAYRFLSTDTIEERILELQETKRELVKNVVGGETSMFKTLSGEEIIGLFE